MLGAGGSSCKVPVLCLQVTWTDSQSRGGGAVCQSKGGGKNGGRVQEESSYDSVYIPQGVLQIFM